MKGDLEYAGHAHPSKESDRRSPVVSGLGLIVITGLLITITTAGTIFGVHLLNRIDNLQVRVNCSLSRTVGKDSNLLGLS